MSLCEPTNQLSSPYFVLATGQTCRDLVVSREGHVPIEVTAEDAWLGVMVRRALPEIQKRLLNSSHEYDAGCAGIAELINLIEQDSNGVAEQDQVRPTQGQA